MGAGPKKQIAIFEPQPSEPKTFVCNIKGCGRKFAWQAHFKYHQLTHTYVVFLSCVTLYVQLCVLSVCVWAFVLGCMCTWLYMCVCVCCKVCLFVTHILASSVSVTVILCISTQHLIGKWKAEPVSFFQEWPSFCMWWCEVRETIPDSPAAAGSHENTHRRTSVCVSGRGLWEVLHNSRQSEKPQPHTHRYAFIAFG